MEQDVDVDNGLSRKLSAFCTLFTFYLVNFVNLFYPDGAMRHTAKSNMLNEIESNKYSLPSLMRNPDLGATVTDFMAILQSIDYNKFERFSNVADEISTKLFSNFLKGEVLDAVIDRYDVEFSIEAAERKHWTEDSTHMEEFEITNSQKFPKSFQNYLEISNNKTKLVKELF